MLLPLFFVPVFGSGVSPFAPGIVFSTPAFANDGGTGSVPAIGFETPRGETGASTLVYALASLASLGQLQWDLEQAMTI